MDKAKKDYTLEDVKREASESKQQQSQHASIQLIVFQLGDEEYAVPIDQIKEVVPTPRIAKMPQMPSYIKGVANIRGDIIAIMDLEKKFGIATEDYKKTNHYTLVIEDEKSNVGILAHQVPDTLRVTTDVIDYNKELMQYSTNGTNGIVGVIKLEKRLVMLLDLIKVIHEETINNI